jgi:hypothetical protein
MVASRDVRRRRAARRDMASRERAGSSIQEHPIKFPKPFVRVQEFWNQNVLAGSVKETYGRLQVAQRY